MSAQGGMITNNLIPLDDKKIFLGTVEPVSKVGQTEEECAVKLSFIRGAVEKYQDKSFNDELVEYVRRIVY